MKTISKISAAVGLSLLTIGAMAQSPFEGQTLAAPAFKTAQPNQSIIRIGSGAKSVGTAPNAYSYLNYEYSDSTNVVNNNAGTYLGRTLYILNSRYDLADTGLANPSKNPYTLIHAYVAFDSMYNANNFQGTPSKDVVSGSLTVDSVEVAFSIANTTGTADTLKIRVVGVDGTGFPDTTHVYATNSFATTTSVGSSTSFSQLVINTGGVAIPGNGHFAVEFNYYGSKSDTCRFVFGFPDISCSSKDYADTTTFGVKIGPAGKIVKANSFTTGYGKFTGTTKSNTVTLPDAGNGEGLSGPCGSILFWQDIDISAWVGYSSTLGINNIAESGLSVNQNYPNPFNKQTQITYNLTKSSDVTFTVCDVTGRELMNNVYTNSTPGQHQITLNANTFSPGIYFYTFNVNGSIVTNKMVITQ